MKKNFYDITFEDGKEKIDFSIGEFDFTNNVTGTSFDKIVSKLERNISKGKVSNFELYHSPTVATCCVTTLDSTLNESETIYTFNNVPEEKMEKLVTLNEYAHSEKAQKKCEEYRNKKNNSFVGMFTKNLIKNLKEFSIPRFIGTFPLAYVICQTFMAFSPDLLTRRIAALPLFLLGVNSYPLVKTIINSIKEHKSNKRIKDFKTEELEEKTEELVEEKQDEKAKIKEEILEETKQINSLLDHLRTETSNIYRKELFEHLTEYMNSIDTKVEKKYEINLKVGSALSSDIEYLTYLYGLKNRVMDQIKKEEYRSSIEELRSQLEVTPEEEYTDEINDNQGFALKMTK